MTSMIHVSVRKKSEDEDNNSDDDSKNSEQVAKYGPLSLDYKF